MSLINEALKKAQRLRSNEPADVAPMPGGDVRVTKRGQPRTTQQLLLIASGGLVLVVLSVVITVWLINRAPSDKSAAKSAAPKISTATTSAGPAPTIVPPVIKVPVVAGENPPTTKTTPLPAPVESPSTTLSPVAATPPPVVAPAPTPVAPPVVVQQRAQPVVETPAPPPAATPPPTLVATAPASAPLADQPAAPPKTDERVHAFVDAIKVAGIRSSGGDSRVLMNDRVFRVNDIVERNLGVRLTKVEADALTFTDGNGALYVKHF